MTNASALISAINAEITADVNITNGQDMNEHAERFWPDRIERQAAAFRRILHRHRPYGTTDNQLRCITCVHDGNRRTSVLWPCDEVRDLADIYQIEVKQ